jgi:serine/threonine protein kinase
VVSVLAGRYRLEERIAEGGFGQVWRATDTLLLRPVAVKVMALNCVAEARRVAQLKHPGIVSVHDVGDGGNFCFIVFDLVEGTNLVERLRQGRPPWQESVAVAAAVAENLHYTHEKGFVHRDIKPANILLDRSGRPVLADFGIALTAGELQHESVTTTGTLAYMSPEQLTPGASVDARTDIYSLGVALYELLTGRLPFHGKTVVALREQILNDVPPPFRAAGIDAPRLEDICLKCLSKKAAGRYATAQDLARDLRRQLEMA